MKALFVAIAIVLVSVGSASWAASPIHTQQVQFKKGESAATVRDSIKGDQIVDYKLRAGAGQSMVVIFNPSNPSAYFNVTKA